MTSYTYSELIQIRNYTRDLKSHTSALCAMLKESEMYEPLDLELQTQIGETVFLDDELDNIGFLCNFISDYCSAELSRMDARMEKAAGAVGNPAPRCSRWW
jgi:hypothetical protein